MLVRTTLVAVLVGLVASAAAPETWLLQAKNVCFSATGSQLADAAFTSQYTGVVTGVRLVWRSGTVDNCKDSTDCVPTRWGAYYDSGGTIEQYNAVYVTQKQHGGAISSTPLLWPANLKPAVDTIANGFYPAQPYTSRTVINTFATSLELHGDVPVFFGQQLMLWYSEAFLGHTVVDNAGTVCADVHFQVKHVSSPTPQDAWTPARTVLAPLAQFGAECCQSRIGGSWFPSRSKTDASPPDAHSLTMLSQPFQGRPADSVLEITQQAGLTRQALQFVGWPGWQQAEPDWVQISTPGVLGQSPGVDHIDGTDLWGYDSPQGVTVDECQSMCVLTPGCNAFDFRTTSDECFFKSALGVAEATAGVLASNPWEAWIFERVRKLQGKVRAAVDIWMPAKDGPNACIAFNVRNVAIDGEFESACVQRSGDDLQLSHFVHGGSSSPLQTITGITDWSQWLSLELQWTSFTVQTPSLNDLTISLKDSSGNVLGTIATAPLLPAGQIALWTSSIYVTGDDTKVQFSNWIIEVESLSAHDIVWKAINPLIWGCPPMGWNGAPVDKHPCPTPDWSSADTFGCTKHVQSNTVDGQAFWTNLEDAKRGCAAWPQCGGFWKNVETKAGGTYHARFLDPSIAVSDYLWTVNTAALATSWFKVEPRCDDLDGGPIESCAGRTSASVCPHEACTASEMDGLCIGKQLVQTSECTSRLDRQTVDCPNALKSALSEPGVYAASCDTQVVQNRIAIPVRPSSLNRWCSLRQSNSCP